MSEPTPETVTDMFPATRAALGRLSEELGYPSFHPSNEITAALAELDAVERDLETLETALRTAGGHLEFEGNVSQAVNVILAALAETRSA